MIEPLESRIAPASLVLTDLDGDKITVTASKPGLTVSNFESIPARDGLRSMYSVDLTSPDFDGTNFIVSVAKGKNAMGIAGDGKVIIGTIQGGTNNFGTIKIAGDLGDLDAGSGSMTVDAIKSLTVDSYGRFEARGGDDAYSQITGNVGSLVVKGHFSDTNFYVTGDLASVKIGGSVIGGLDAGDGQIFATGDIGKVAIKKDLRGGSGVSTGFIGAGHSLGSVSIGGSIYGGTGGNSGNVFAALDLDGAIVKVTVGGSIFGGDGDFSGYIGSKFTGFEEHQVDIGTIQIGKDLVGGKGQVSGSVDARKAGTIGKIVIKGSILGGNAFASARVHAGTDIGIITVGGSVYGGDGSDSGSITTGHIGTAQIGGSIYGGKGTYSGEIFSNVTGIDLLSIKGDVRGGTGSFSGTVYSDGQIGKLILGGLAIPGTGTSSGVIQ